MVEREKIEEFFSYISKFNKIALIGHVNPDGDSIGSLTGMGDFLVNNNKEVVKLVPTPYPDFLAFLDKKREILVYREEKEKTKEALRWAELIICLDFNSLSRIDELGEEVKKVERPKLLIDHHLWPDTEAFNLIISRPQSSSTCELVYTLLIELLKLHGNLAPLSLFGESALYTGLMTDTNNFANSVEPNTFKTAALMLEHGVDKTAIQQMVFSGFSEERMRLMGYMLLKNLKVFKEQKAAVMLMTKKIKNRFSFSTGDSEGFVNLALNIEGIEVSAIFTEDDGFIKVSLRSKGDFSVNDLSRAYFNGGGHKNAAGGRLYMPLNEVIEYYLEALEKYRHTI